MAKKILSCMLAFTFMFSIVSIAQADGIYTGSYRKSCKDIKYNKSNSGLYAICRKRDGSWVKASLSAPKGRCADIQNIDGMLQCVHAN